jgi:hypothetical protein
MPISDALAQYNKLIAPEPPKRKPFNDIIIMTVASWPGYLTAGIVNGFVAQIAAVSMEAFFLLLLTATLYFAAAARALGLRDEWFATIALFRGGSYITSFFMLLFVCGFIMLAGGTTIYLVLFDGVNSDVAATVTVLGAAACSLPLIMKVWPLFAIPFTCPYSDGYESFRHGWSGPGLIDAWKSTEAPNAFMDHTLPVIGTFIIGVGLYVVALTYGGHIGAVAIVINLLFYFLFMPVWSTMMADSGNLLYDFTKKSS